MTDVREPIPALEPTAWTTAMRRTLLSISLVALIATLGSSLFVPSANAVSIELEATSPTNGLVVGDSVSFDIYLREPYEEILEFSVGVYFDPASLQYDPANSEVATYILYTGGKRASFLLPAHDPWSYGRTLPWPLWTGSKPPGIEAIQIAFVSENGFPAFFVQDNTWIGSISFDVVGPPGETAVGLDFTDLGGTTFTTLVPDYQADTNEIVEIKDTIGVNEVTLTIVPEPTAGLLVGVGFAGIAWFRKRRERAPAERKAATG